ncbi:MAG: DUF5368 family protein [Salinarimonas sp.]
MQDFHPAILFVIAQETLGILLWLGIGLAVIVLALYAIALMRGLALRGTPMRIAAIFGILVGIVAMAAAPPLTDAGFRHLVAGIDYVFLALIGIGGFVATVIAVTPLIAVLGLGGVREERVSLTAPAE